MSFSLSKVFVLFMALSPLLALGQTSKAGLLKSLPSSIEAFNDAPVVLKSDKDVIDKLRSKLPFYGLSLDDYLRVRSKSNPKGRYRGVFFKNQNFLITDISDHATEIEGESYRWFKVKSKNIEGWTYGKFVKVLTKVSDPPPNTYMPESKDMKWFYTRFGYSTWELVNKLDITSFSMEEIRVLLENSKKYNEQARITLESVFFPHWYEKPNDPKFAYILKYVYSHEYYSAVLGQSWFVPMNYLPLKKMNDIAWMKKLLDNLGKNSYYCPVQKRIQDGSFAKVDSTVKKMVFEKFPRCTKVK